MFSIISTQFAKYCRLARTLIAILGASALVACADSSTQPCILAATVRPTRPDTATIKVGAATIAIAGAEWGACDNGPPAAEYVWKNTDSTIARVTPIDSLHAQILGLRPGLAVVTPFYRNSALAIAPLGGVTVTVVP